MVRNSFRVQRLLLYRCSVGDSMLDLLLCTAALDNVTVVLMNHSLAEGIEILRMSGSECDMQAVDFDEDGDQDLIMGKSADHMLRPTLSRYFEMTASRKLEERTGPDNPLDVFGDHVQRIADFDGDGRLDVLCTDGDAAGMRRWRYFRRTAAGTFIEPWENPFAGIEMPDMIYRYEIHVVDWNSDSFPDVLFLQAIGQDTYWKLTLFKHLVDQDLRRNSQFDAYQDIQPFLFSSFSLVDWNGDGFQDVVLKEQRIHSSSTSPGLQLYQYRPKAMKEVAGVFDGINPSLNAKGQTALAYSAFADWDGDGDLDLLLFLASDWKVHFHEMKFGLLQEERADHPFKEIDLNLGYLKIDVWKLPKPMLLDYDHDGDLDLFLSPPDGRYFEQLADGSLREWPKDQNPLGSAMKSLKSLRPASRRRRQNDIVGEYYSWHFIDCDADGDFDLVQVPDSGLHYHQAPAQACEYSRTAHLWAPDEHHWRCDADFLCLGTNVSQYLGGAWQSRSIFSVVDGQLNMYVQRGHEHGIELWTPGFCVPSAPCNEKGHCFSGQAQCSCSVGHDAADCSACQRLYYTGKKDLQVQDCQACPGANGQVCYGRGTCFDDIVAKRLQHEATAEWMAIGNGSCVCNEPHFFGTDEDGRSTCMEGHCPAGTEEIDGRCRPCVGGSFSLAGGLCKDCPAGKFSPKGSSNCSPCPQGRFSKTPGSLSCEACPAGTHEVDKQYCSPCPQGTISGSGSEICSPCEAGRFAKEALTCEPCPGGTSARSGSSTCQSCPLGQVSWPDSGVCRSCDGLLVRAVPDATRQTCQVFAMDIVLGLVCWISCACFCFLLMTGCFGRLPISDISLQGEKLVVTTSMAHGLLKRAGSLASFIGTGVPALDSGSTWKVKALSSYQLTLHGEPASMPLDTSIGHLRLQFPQSFLSVGIWRCPLLGWCLFFGAATACAASQIMWSLALVVLGFGFCTGFAILASCQRQGQSGLCVEISSPAAEGVGELKNVTWGLF